MVSASPSLIARSSLEEMLDSLRRRDEGEKPKELPPALPARPTSKARLPSARRSLPNNFKVEDAEGSPECLSSLNKRKERDSGFKAGHFGVKRMDKDQNVESPYDGAPEECQIRPEKIGKSDWDDNIGYFINKVILEGDSTFTDLVLFLCFFTLRYYLCVLTELSSVRYVSLLLDMFWVLKLFSFVLFDCDDSREFEF